MLNINKYEVAATYFKGGNGNERHCVYVEIWGLEPLVSLKMGEPYWVFVSKQEFFDDTKEGAVAQYLAAKPAILQSLNADFYLREYGFEGLLSVSDTIGYKELD